MIYFLSLGSNIDPQKNIPASVAFLRKKFRVLAVSSVYETEPVGTASSGKFWNLAVQFDSDLEEDVLAVILRQMEEMLGRRRSISDKFAPRTIDMDLLPQPDYQHQAFIMVPLAEIAPQEKDPETGKTFEQLAEVLRKKEAGKFRKIETVKEQKPHI
ncbi:MAG: 2-amino-4-hydroxy-6-hydroxymethyldihydropteridine diphosphokinase [Candidatus Omnitrophica bacterium]|nr:2-amino-4-hydroxy-6-hydroxymethyldihydropteridine diphosphokinase [Candidatus Omnitrophota bacterium]